MNSGINTISKATRQQHQQQQQQQQKQPGTPKPSVTSEMTTAASKGAISIMSNVANISIPAMMTDRLKDIAVTNSLRQRRIVKTTQSSFSARGGVRGAHPKHKNSSFSSATGATTSEDILKRRSRSWLIVSNERRERTRSYQRYKMSTMRIRMRVRTSNRVRGTHDDRSYRALCRRFLRRPALLQSLDPSKFAKRTYNRVCSQSSRPTTSDTLLEANANAAAQTLTDHHHFTAHYRLSTHIWHAKRMTMHKLTCRSPGGSPGQRCVYLPSRHRGRGWKAVLKVINSRTTDALGEKEEDDNDGGVASTKVSA